MKVMHFYKDSIDTEKEGCAGRIGSAQPHLSHF